MRTQHGFLLFLCVFFFDLQQLRLLPGQYRHYLFAVLRQPLRLVYRRRICGACAGNACKFTKRFLRLQRLLLKAKKRRGVCPVYLFPVVPLYPVSLAPYSSISRRSVLSSSSLVRHGIIFTENRSFLFSYVDE